MSTRRGVVRARSRCGAKVRVLPATGLICAHASCQPRPTKTVRSVVPYARGGTTDILARSHGEIVRIPGAPDVRERLAPDGAEVVAAKPQQFAAYIRAGIARWGKVISQGRIRPE